MLLILLTKLSRLVREEPESFSAQASLGILLGCVAITYGYSVFCHAKFGQTIGKMLTRVCVVTASSESKLSLSQAIRRDIIPMVVTLGLLVIGRVEVSLGDRVEIAISFVVVGWWLAELLTMLTNRRRRALHDFVAGTVVVRAEAIGAERFEYRQRITGIWSVVISALVVSFAWPSVKHWFLPEYVVIYRGSEFREHIPAGQTWPTATTTGIELKNHWQRNLIFAKVDINQWLGSEGEDPLRDSLRCTTTRYQRPIKAGGVQSLGRSQSGFWDPNDSPYFLWRFGVDQQMRPSRIAGQITFWEGGSIESADVEIVNFVEGEEFEINGKTVSILRISPVNSGPRHSVSFGMRDEGLFIAGVEFTGTDGTLIEGDEPDFRDKSNTETGYSHACSVEFPEAPPKSGNFVIRYWTDLTAQNLPFDFSGFKESDHRPAEQHALSWDLGEPADRLMQARPQDADWGDPTDSEALDLQVNILPKRLKTYDNLSYPSTLLDFQFKISGQDSLIARALEIHDIAMVSGGEDWLRHEDGKRKWVALEEIGWRKPPNSYQLRFPWNYSGEQVEIKIDGTIRLAFGVDEKIETFPIQDIEKDFKIDVAGASLNGGGREWKLTGKVASIREISILDRKGDVLDTRQLPPIEFLSIESIRYLEGLGEEVSAEAVKIEARYFDRWEWCDYPFSKQLKFVSDKE